MSHSEYIPTIGIETHVQLKTKTKLFAAVGNEAKDAAPNSLISHICIGLPGALPVLNQKALELATQAAIALNTKPEKFSKFDRKHYFYPDLPKGYQITQYDQPIILGGHVEIETDGLKKRVNISRVHLEEDAGKNTHPAGADYSLIDFNRAGTPLLEIVSEPDINSPAQAKAYARELYLLMKYADVSDCDLYLGHMRFDVNISVSKDPKQLGIRSEVKNLNSFRSVENAVAYEIKRQTELLKKGETNIQETRGWDEAKQKTTSQRGKEEAHDYRYMPEPDIPPIELDEEYTENIKAKMPGLPGDYRRQFKGIDIDPKTIEDIIASPKTTKLLSRICQNSGPTEARRIAFWMLTGAEVIADTVTGEGDLLDKYDQINETKLVKLAKLVSDKQLSSTAGKEIFIELLKTGRDPEKIAAEKKLFQVSNESEIEKIVTKVLAQNPKAAEEVKGGKAKAIGFLVGQVMAASKGQANPEVAQKLIKQQLKL